MNNQVLYEQTTRVLKDLGGRKELNGFDIMRQMVMESAILGLGFVRKEDILQWMNEYAEDDGVSVGTIRGRLDYSQRCMHINNTKAYQEQFGGYGRVEINKIVQRASAMVRKRMGLPESVKQKVNIEDGEIYWYVNGEGEVKKAISDETSAAENVLHRFGNYYRSREEAEANRAKWTQKATEKE